MAAAASPAAAAQRGPKFRMRRALLAAAMAMVERGEIPSIAGLAEGAGVSRATAYRYFPTQSALVEAIVDESLGPIMQWQPASQSAQGRVDELLCHAYPRLEQFEVQLRAAVQLSLMQSAQQHAKPSPREARLARGHRVEMLTLAAEPLRAPLGKRRFERLIQALSLVYGTEVFLILKDIWHLELPAILEVVRWAASAIVERAMTDVTARKRHSPGRRLCSASGT